MAKMTNCFDEFLSKIVLGMLTCVCIKHVKIQCFVLASELLMFFCQIHTKICFFLASDYENSVLSFKKDSKWVNFIVCQDQTSQ